MHCDFERGLTWLQPSALLAEPTLMSIACLAKTLLTELHNKLGAFAAWTRLYTYQQKISLVLKCKAVPL